MGINEMAPLLFGIATVIFLLIAMGYARNRSWGSRVWLFLAGMCALVFGVSSQFALVDLSLAAAAVFLLISYGCLYLLLCLVAAKEHEGLAIASGLVCCLMLAQCASRLFPMPF